MAQNNILVVTMFHEMVKGGNFVLMVRLYTLAVVVLGFKGFMLVVFIGYQ